MLEARLGSERGCLLGAPEHADEPAHLGQRLAPGLLDDLERLALLLLIGLEPTANRARLDGHHAHAVADDVVELARDPGALLGDGFASFVLPLALELLGTLLRVGSLPELAADREGPPTRRCRR